MGSPDIPAVPAVEPAPTSEDIVAKMSEQEKNDELEKAKQEAIRKQKLIAQGMKGRSATILTSPMGITTPAPTRSTILTGTMGSTYAAMKKAVG